MKDQPFARVRQLYAKFCSSSRSDQMTFRVRIQKQAFFREACFSSILPFRVSFLSALNTHLAKHPSRTPRHGVKKTHTTTTTARQQRHNNNNNTIWGGSVCFNRRGASTPLWGVETMLSPSRRPNPIPAIPPYVVKTPHLHGAPTLEETV